MIQRRVLALVSAAFLCGTVALAAPGDPFGGDDAGCFPAGKDAAKCENAVEKAASKALVCILGCHVKRADGKLADDTAEDACESGPTKSCKSKYDAATGPSSKVNALCPPCLDATTRASVFAGLESTLDGATNAAVYCGSGTGPFGGDDLGNVPAAKSTDQKCEDAVAKAVAKASACIVKCDMKRAAGKLADDTAEDACESGATKSCKVKFDAATGPTSKINALCPACLDATARAGLFASAETQLDTLNGVTYCCPPTTTTTTVSTTTTTTSTTQPLGTVLQGVLQATTGRFNYNLVVGVPGSDAACSALFPGSHTCTYANLQSAEAAGDLAGRKDLNGTTVTSFWAIDSTHADVLQCTTTVAWDYQTAHTGHFAEIVDLNNGTGALGPLRSGQAQSAICAGSSWVGCCL